MNHCTVAAGLQYTHLILEESLGRNENGIIHKPPVNITMVNKYMNFTKKRKELLTFQHSNIIASITVHNRTTVILQFLYI